MAENPRWKDEAEMLSALIDQRYDSRAEFADMLGVTDDVMSNICRGVTRLKGDRRLKAAKLLGIEEDQLKVVVNKTPKPRDPKLPGPPLRIVRAGYREVPVYGSVPAGPPASSFSDAVETIEMPEWGNNFDRWGRFVYGNSMNPEFEDGDIVIFENRAAQYGPDYGHGVYAVKEGDDVFKVLREPHVGKLEFWPTNPQIEPFSAEGWEIMGVAIRRIRRGLKFEDERKYPAGWIHRFDG